MRIQTKLLSGIAAVSLIVGGGAFAAHAYTTYSNFNINVPGWNGAANTGTQEKSVSNHVGNIELTSLGCTNRKVDAAMMRSNGTLRGPWVYDLEPGQNKGLNNSIPAGSLAVAHISSKLTTTTTCNVQGKWRAY